MVSPFPLSSKDNPYQLKKHGLYKKLIKHGSIQCPNDKYIKIASFIINKEKLPTIKELQMNYATNELLNVEFAIV